MRKEQEDACQDQHEAQEANTPDVEVIDIEKTGERSGDASQPGEKGVNGHIHLASARGCDLCDPEVPGQKGAGKTDIGDCAGNRKSR